MPFPNSEKEKNIPTYLELSNFYKNFSHTSNSANTGLIFDRFIDTWSESDLSCRANNSHEEEKKKDDENKKKKKDDENKKKKKVFYTEIIHSFKERNRNGAISDVLKGFIRKREKLLTSAAGEVFVLKTHWHMVSGLGTGHPYEAGFIWHRTLGVPYLPGSSIKGLFRAWMENYCDEEDEENDQKKKDRINYLMGGEEGAGNLIFFDAIPERCPELTLDIMNPHYSKYYENPENPPADHHSPVPIYFIATAQNQPFQFAIGHRRPNAPNAKDDVKNAVALLKEALICLGAGGKTAAGYGQFSDLNASSSNVSGCEPKEFVWEGVKLKSNPGSGKLSVSFIKNNNTAHAHGSKASAIRGSLPENIRERLKKKRELNNINAVVRKEGSDFILLRIDM